MAGGFDSSNNYNRGIASWQRDASYERAAKHRENLLRRMRIVAKSRFNAHDRLIAKSSATNVGLQLANLYTIAIGILLIQFPNSAVVLPLSNALNYVSLLASVFVQIMALIESFKDYSGKAQAMHSCAMEVNQLMQLLELHEDIGITELKRYGEKYNKIMIDTNLNHSDVDYSKYKIDTEIKAKEERKRQGASEDGRKAPERVEGKNSDESEGMPLSLRQVWWRVRYVWNVYSLTTMIVVGPWVVLWALHWLKIR